MLQSAEPLDAVVRISVGRHVSAAASEYARAKIGWALRYAGEPVLSVRVRLAGHADPAVDEPITAQVNVNMAGVAVRAQVTAATTREAIDALADRLRARLERLSRRWEAQRGGSRVAADATSWHHGAAPRRRLPYFPRPVEEREILRRKSFALAEETCDEAAFDMALLDYDFHLFTESGSGVDSVLYRPGPTGLRLAQLDPRPDQVSAGSEAVSISSARAPELGVDAAVDRLEVTGWPFVFFRDPERGRGQVLYHRYDGHYGLLTPAAG
ncbi:sigma 54 modulation/S30EA ribosomal C-terminal domain-containing protein [Nocardia neocaledoniensis]|uniref:sigma 54 modulation/S30EA ribosomal C-terminal domain-containing protein n=1 Tax=Nocardia neocaledoniensis TaxID=236511 RepID=UPI0024583460|nr:sigma 54 modulation/S30EA ribosomal C-terminal domain-containing protein [Nocardia neocaledoniensis]